MRRLLVCIHPALLAVLLMCSSCIRNPVGNPDDQNPLTPSTDNPSAMGLVWSPDEQFVYSIGAQGLQSISVAGGAATTLDARQLSFQSLTLSGTGSSLYYFATADSFSASHTLMRWRRSDGVLDTVLTGVRDYLASPISDDIVYRPTDTDTLVFYTPATRAKRTVGYRVPLTFSPDGHDLLMHNPGAAYSSFLVFHTADGTETGITLDRGLNSYLFAWYADGMIGLWIVLDEGGSHAYAYNFTTGFTDTVKYINAPYVASGFAFSANTPRVGFWSTKGTSFTFVPLFGNVPTAWDYIVNVYSFATHTSTPYTVGNTGNASASGGMAFSPSGTRMACAYRGGVTLLNLQ